MVSEHSRIDLVAYDRSGQVVLLAEAKSRLGTTKQWAARLRENMLAHGDLPESAYFLIATPERMYLWNRQPSPSAQAPPDFTIDTADVLQTYFRNLHVERSEIAPEAFELLILTWLTDISRSDGSVLAEDASSQSFSEFKRSLQQARIETNSVQ